jgi:hypothetical protein
VSDSIYLEGAAVAVVVARASRADSQKRRAENVDIGWSPAVSGGEGPGDERRASGAVVGLARTSVWRTVFMCKPPFSIVENCLQVIIRVYGGISCAAVASLKVMHFFVCTIKQLVRVARTRFESRAHTRRELRFTGIGDQHGMTAQYVDELVLPGMGVP